MSSENVRIWSDEHQAFWRPGGRGYTVHKAAAGVWSIVDAQAGTRGLGPEKKVRLIKVEPAPPAAASTDLCCPFCSEGDFDLVGLKMHLQRGWCDVFENVETAGVL